MAERTPTSAGRATAIAPDRAWSIDHTTTFDVWLVSLTPERQAQVKAAIQRVAESGPMLGRPRVDSLSRTSLHNLKELRIRGGVRVLFAFDQNRTAVMLTGGDKTGSWNRWYRGAIRTAEREFDNYQRGKGRGSACLSTSLGQSRGGSSR